MDVHGAAIGVVHAVDAELLVELGMECWVASVEGADQPVDLFEEAPNLPGREPLRGCVRVPKVDFGGGPGSGNLGDPLLHDGGSVPASRAARVAIQAVLAVGQHLLGGPPLVTGWALRLAVARVWQVRSRLAGLNSSASHSSRRLTRSTSRRYRDFRCWKAVVGLAADPLAL